MFILKREALKSQKARGIYDILVDRNDAPKTSFVHYGAKDVHVLSAIAYFNNLHPQLFVRPCPENPNHGGTVAGFQSQSVTSKDLFAHLQKVRRAINASGEKADIVIMPMLPALASAVAAPRKYIVWGNGHNGVTAGIGETVTLPLDGNEPMHWLSKNYNPNDVEIEFVASKDACYCVQIRAASAHMDISPQPVGSFAGFIPTGKVTVKSIFEVVNLDDLGELEKLKALDTTGLVVIQKSGSMLSHAAAHCRGAGIAFAIGDAEIGDMLVEVASGWVVKGDENTVAAPYKPEDTLSDFMEGFDEPTSWNSRLLGTFFHQWATTPMGKTSQVAYLGGRFARWLVQTGLTAMCGEGRHFSSVHMGGNGATVIKKAYKDAFGTINPSRSAVLEPLKLSGATRTELLGVASWASAYFGLSWNSGMGGKKWRNCAIQARECLLAMSSGNTKLIIKHLNLLENGVHNNGRLYDKFQDVIAWLDSSTKPFSLSSGVAKAACVAKEALSAISSRGSHEQIEISKEWKIMSEIDPNLFGDTDEEEGSEEEEVSHNEPSVVERYTIEVEE